MDETVQKIELYNQIHREQAKLAAIVDEKKITTEEEFIKLPEFVALQKLKENFKKLYE